MFLDGKFFFVTNTMSHTLQNHQHIPPWEKENHVQKCLGKGYVSSLESIILRYRP